VTLSKLTRIRRYLYLGYADSEVHAKTAAEHLIDIIAYYFIDNDRL
jgi:hypothetical protein